MTTDQTAKSAAAVRQLAAAVPPAGLDGWQTAEWYAGQLGALRYHAAVLASAAEASR